LCTSRRLAEHIGGYQRTVVARSGGFAPRFARLLPLIIERDDGAINDDCCVGFWR